VTRGSEPFNFDGMYTAYPALRDHILANGKRVAPRGEATVEALGMAFSIRDAVNRGVPVGCGRKVGVKMQVIDGTGNLAGASYPDVAIRLAGVMDRFADDLPGFSVNDTPNQPEMETADIEAIRSRQPGLETGDRFFQGAYGPRIGDQLEKVEGQLRRDPSTRQAVVSLWSETDREPSWKDRPCTTEFQLMVREGALDVFVFMRANDLWTGTCYDVWQFGQVQAAMAHVLGIPHGTYHHYATSLHIYERDVEKFKEVQFWPSSTEQAVVNPRESWGPDWDALEPGTYKSWPQVREAFTRMLEAARHGSEYEPGNHVEAWYWGVLKQAVPAA
jgi:hypothetical protein